MWIFNTLPDRIRQRLAADHHFQVIQTKQHGMDLLLAGRNHIDKRDGIDHHHMLLTAHGRHLVIKAEIVY